MICDILQDGFSVSWCDPNDQPQCAKTWDRDITEDSLPSQDIGKLFNLDQHSNDPECPPLNWITDIISRFLYSDITGPILTGQQNMLVFIITFMLAQNEYINQRTLYLQHFTLLLEGYSKQVSFKTYLDYYRP